MKAILYVSRGCGACGKFLAMLASSKKALMATDIRIIEDSDKNWMEFQGLRTGSTPTLVVYPTNGRPAVYTGAQAGQALVAMM